jgi:NAD(P)-dependent dehydrogenase (short-subunit alcohol dehydrogenase family)/predicted SnoaL-like aldol condensation-catalyzing enzyme
MNNQTKKNVVITGSGSGLGRDIALGFSAKGYRVFGTAMSLEEIEDLKNASGGTVTLSQCDITNEAAVKAWANEVAIQTEGGLDILVNNAGILTPGPIEVLSLNAIKREFEVNVFGAIAVVNSFLPALRKTRGRIVQVSTMTATLPFPFNGPSGASKAAFDALAAVYRAELKPFGIDFVLAVAGNMRTGGPAKTAAALKRVADQMTSEQRDLYGKAFDTFATTLNTMQGSGLDSVSAANRVIELSEQVPAPSRGAVGADAEEILRFVREKSDAEQDAMRLQVVGLGPKQATVQTDFASINQKEPAIHVLVDPNDARAVRNKDMILDHYARMINGKDAQTGTRNFDNGYIQHNPLMPDGRGPLAEFFSKIAKGRDTSRIVVHKIIAVGDYVWTHVNFLNFFSDDPDDSGVAGVDIFKMDANGRSIEHWDVLQFVGNPKNSAPFMGPNIPRANSNGMFEERTER